MNGLKEKTSINSPILIGRIPAFQLWVNTTSKYTEERFYAESDIEKYFSQDSSIWLRDTSKGEFEFNISTGLSDLVIHFLSKVSEVKQIYLLKELDAILHVWSIVPEKATNVKKRIYEQERKLIHFFKETLFFDFHIDVLSSIKYLENTSALLVFKRE